MGDQWEYILPTLLTLLLGLVLGMLIVVGAMTLAEPRDPFPRPIPPAPERRALGVPLADISPDAARAIEAVA